MRMVFLKYFEIDKLNRNSIPNLKSLFERKKLIKRIGFESILGKIKQKKPEEIDLYRDGVNIEGECIFDPNKNCLGQHSFEYG